MLDGFTEKILKWLVSGGGVAAILKVLYDYYYKKEDREKSQLEGVAQAQTDLIEDYESATAYWREQADELDDEVESIREQNEILRQQNDLLRNELERKEKENEELLRKIDSVEERNKILSNEIERTADYIQTLQSHFDNLRGIVTELTNWIPEDREQKLKEKYGDILVKSKKHTKPFEPNIPEKEFDDGSV